MTLGLVLASFVLQQAPVTVSFDLRGLDEADYRAIDGLTLERKVGLRLVQEGFALVATEATVRLRLTREAKVLKLEATGGAKVLERLVRFERVSLPELHLEVAQKAAELARASDVPKVAPTVVERPPEPPPKPVVEPEHRFSLALAGGVASRGEALEGLVLASARLALGVIGIDLEVGGGPGATQVVNAFGVAGALGVGVRLALHERLFFEPSLAGGLSVHGYTVKDRFVADQRGLSVSPAGWLRIRLGWWLTEHLALELRLALGLTVPLEHQSEGVRLWSRDALRPEACLGARWTF